MSMIGEYRQLTPAQLDKLLRNPDNVGQFLEQFDADEDFQTGFDDDDDDDFDEEEGGGSPRAKDDDDEDEDEDEEDEYGGGSLGGDDDSMGKYFSLDKAWHAIHFMLNDSAWEGSGPLFDAVLGGTEVGEDMGYGPARVLTPDEVRAVAAALIKMDRNALKKKFDPKAMQKADVYVGDMTFLELSARLKELTAFFEEAAESGNAMLLTIS